MAPAPAPAAALLDFASRRSPVYGLRGAVASSQPLASAAGLRILQAGGNAADAAVAMAAALNVTEPCSTGIGGDAFALWYDARRRAVESVQGNGRSPAALTLELAKERGCKHMLPPLHAITVTVPGAAAAWADIVEKYGHLSLAEVLQPAIELAEGGYPVSPVTAAQWELGIPQLLQGGPHAGDMLYEGTRAPRPGEVMRLPLLAKTFRALAAEGKAGFYEGRVAAAIVEAVQALGGVLALEDLAAHRTAFEAPICSTYRGLRVWEVPPPTQGVAALEALNIMEAYGDVGKLPRGSPEYLHIAIEAMRMAFADSLTHVADPFHAPCPTDDLLSKEYAASRAKLIQTKQSVAIEAGLPTRPGGADTVYFAVVDGDGNGCSMINSNYWGFGTGIIPAGCGFTLQNRGHSFSLDAGHPNCVGPRKRPYHTIMPGLTTTSAPASGQGVAGNTEYGNQTTLKGGDAGDLHSVFGVMGGFMQPQGHMQVISNLVDFGLNPQAALDAPRFCIGGLPCLEAGHGPHPVATSFFYLEDGPNRVAVAGALRAMGHRVELATGAARVHFGRGQVILRDPKTGVLCAGSDPRADGCAMAW
eukprot:SM000005S17138  [mRNA]  locus=s5:336226:339832:- [translate_table: standard]